MLIFFFFFLILKELYCSSVKKFFEYVENFEFETMKKLCDESEG